MHASLFTTLFYISALVNVLTLLYYVSQSSVKCGNVTNFVLPDTTSRSAATPPQRRIFIDLGANNGSSISYFIDPISSHIHGDVSFQGGRDNSSLKGMGSKGGWEIIAVEANDKHTRTLEALRKTLSGSHLVSEFTIYGGVAISTTSGNTSLILDYNNFAGAGATIVPDTATAKGSKIQIPSLGIGELFQTAKILPTDFVVLKVDIEGYEFELLRYMFMHGLHKLIDVLAVEYHDVPGYWKTKGYEQKYKRHHNCLNWIMEEIGNMQIENWG